jgi:hypothetical protein
MTRGSQIDARRDQLQILKFERRCLRRLAAALLSESAGKTVKLTAIAAASAALLSLQGAPAAFAAKIGAPSPEASSAPAFAAASLACQDLRSMIDSGAATADLAHGLARLFAIVDSEHARFEAMAREASARLLEVVAEPDIGDGGGNKTLMSWLTQYMTSAR